VASDRVSIVLDRVVEFTILDVHGLHAVAPFFLLQLVIHHFFQTHALIVEQRDQAVVVASVADNVVAGLAPVIKVQIVENHVIRRSHLQLQVKCDVHVTQVAGNIERGATTLISLSN